MISLLRRDFIALSTQAFQAARPSRLVAQSYIWTQEMRKRGISLGDGIDEILNSTGSAGFRQIELMSEFFSPELRTRTLAGLKKSGLTAPIVYFGGTLHEADGARKTMAQASELASFVRDAGTVALNHNPNPKPAKALKTDDELKVQAEWLTNLDNQIRAKGLRFFVHHHDPEMLADAREWRHIRTNTGCELCLDTDWIRRGGQNPAAILREAGSRTASVHVRNSRDNVWLESVSDGDIDYRTIAGVLKDLKIHPYLVAELAYQTETKITRPLAENLKQSRQYMELVFS